MKPGEPLWVDITDDWLDDEYSSEPEIAEIQRFLGKKVKAEVIRRHLLAEGIGKPGALEIRHIETETSARRPHELTIKAMIRVEGVAWKDKDPETGLFVENTDHKLIKKDAILMRRTFIKNDRGDVDRAYFDTMGVGKAKLPDNFGREYYKRAIPLLRKLEVTSVDTEPTTEADDPKREEGRYIGAYVWPRYGYKNTNMNETLDEFLKYIQNDRKIKLSDEEAYDIKSITIMNKLSGHEIARDDQKVKVGSDFLKGYDANGKPTRGVSWHGTIPDIHNNASPEMVMMIEELLRK